MPDFSYPQTGVVVRNISRVSQMAVQTLTDLYVADVLDLIGKRGNLSLHSITGIKICGPAITCQSADLELRKMAIDLAQPGDVLVIDAGGSIERSCFGEYTAQQMRTRNMAGIVIDGAVRDIEQLQQMQFSTFAKGITPRNYEYPQGGDSGAVNVPICCAGTFVCPGDLILGDKDGVIVIPKNLAEQIAPTIEAIICKKQDARKGRMGKPFNVEANLKARGYTFRER